MAHLIDYSGGYPGAAAIRAAGFDGAVRYLCNSPERGLTKKRITKEEADDYKAHGLQLVSNWQLGKGSSADFKVGDPFRTGQDHGRRALQAHFEAGGPGFCPIYFSVDEDVTLDTWNFRVLPWLNGIASIIGKEWVGVYGGQRSMWWAEEDGFKWRWQTLAWSRYDERTGNWNSALPVQWVAGVNIRQYEVDKQKVNGIVIDRNTTHTNDYGQWSIDRKPKENDTPVKETEPVAKPNYTQIDMYGSGYSNRWGARISNILGHTQEAPDSATPENLARYCNGSNGVSYHDIIGHGRLVRVVNPDFASWSVLDANPYTYNICFSGSRAAMSRAEWLKREIDIRIFAWRCIEVARAKGVSTDLIKPPYRVKDGISDHNYVTRALGIGNHTDLGPNFPWDRLEAFLREYLAGAAPKPIVNMINEEAKRAAAWIGKPLEEEKTNPDKIGKRRAYEGGVIYWTPKTGAHAIPNRLFETYARLGHETSFLGYPVGDHTVLHKDNDKSKEIVGGVQGFEYGAIYRKEGDHIGYAVGGDIRNAWNRSGFENGPYGWPMGPEEEITPGVKVQQFENARMLWAPGKIIGLVPTDGHDQVVKVF